MPTFKEDLHMGNRLPVVLCGCCCGGNGGSGGGGGGSTEIPDGSITTNKLADGAVTNPKIADSAVTLRKLGEDVKSVIYGGGGGGGEQDRAYAPDEFSGLGKVYLQKNITTIGGTEKNLLTQDMLYKDGDGGARVPNTNTIFVVRYDYDLNGETVLVPKDCVILFDGGNIKNGKLVSNDTSILGDIPKESALYGQYYYDKKPLNYNLNVVKSANACVDFAFMTPADFVDYRFYAQDVISFYYNNTKYVLVTGNIESSSPQRCFMLLFDGNYDFKGSKEISEYGHGGGLTVCENKLYMCGHGSKVAVYNLADVVSSCLSDNAAPHSEVYETKITPAEFKTFPYQDVVGIDYDPSTEEFVVFNGDKPVIYDKSFNLKRACTVSVEANIRNAIKSNVVWQGGVLKKGIVYGTAWVSDYPSIDRGNNILYVFDTVKDRVVSFEKISIPYQEAECEGLTKDPDDDNNLCFMASSNVDNGSSVLGICKVSQVNDLYGRDTKKEGSSGIVNYIRQNYVSVDNSYNFSQGPSNGSSLRPFKTIGTALAMLFFTSGRTLIRIKYTGTNYYLPKLEYTSDTLYFRGVDGTPTIIVDSLIIRGGNMMFSDLNIVTKSRIYVLLNGYLLMQRVAMDGYVNEERHDMAIHINDNSNVKLENVTMRGYETAINCNMSTFKSQSLSISECDTAIYAIYSDFGIVGTTIEDCTTGISVRRTPVNMNSITASDVDTLFNIDDSLINDSGISSMTLSDVTTVVSKDSYYRGRINLMYRVTSTQDVEALFSLMNKGVFNATSIGFFVPSMGITYGGKTLTEGTYVYMNPGFILEGQVYKLITEATVGSTKVFTIIPTQGSFGDRPTLDNTYKGFIYYDEDIKGHIEWIGYSWREMKNELYPTDNYWSKIGELDSSSSVFDGDSVAILDTTYTSEWEGWTNIEDDTVYRKKFVISGIPFTQGDLIRIVITGADRNTILQVTYANDVDDDLPVTPEIYNTNGVYIKTPAVGDYTRTNVYVNSDVQTFDGKIEFFKKVG